MCVTVFNSYRQHLGSHIPSSGVQVRAGYFRVSIFHRTLTWTTGSVTQHARTQHAVFRMRAYAHGGWAHRQRDSTTFLTRKNVFLCS